MHPSPHIDSPAQSESQSLVPRQGKLAFFLVTGLFFLWAIPNNLNDVLIRQFMKSFEITRLQAGLVQSAFYLAVFRYPLARDGGARGLLMGALMAEIQMANAAGFFFQAIKGAGTSANSPPQE